jgi:hypothetical protein
LKRRRNFNAPTLRQTAVDALKIGAPPERPTSRKPPLLIIKKAQRFSVAERSSG